MKTFRKYSSIENTYRRAHIEKWIGKYPELLTCKAIATEKIHGSNFSINIFNDDGNIEVTFGKRTSLLEPTEAFFNHQQVMQQEEEINLIRALKQYVINQNIKIMRVYGELFGQGVQKFDYEKVQTKTGKTFRIFDIIIEERTLPPFHAINILEDINQEHMYVPIMGIFDTLEEAINFDITFKSNFSSDKCSYLSEGIVIRPYDKKIGYIDLETGKDVELILKKKNEIHADKTKNKVKNKVSLERSEEYKKLLEEYHTYITPARAESAFSKEGWIKESSEIGKYIKLIMDDCKEDFFKDYKDEFIELDDREKKLLFSQSGKKIVEILKNYL